MAESMIKNITTAIERAEKVTAGLRRLAALPEFAPFDLSAADIPLGMIQLFPVDPTENADHRKEAVALARVLGGVWHKLERGSGLLRAWRCSNATFPGLDKCAIVIHRVEPERPALVEVIDLNFGVN